MDPQNFEKFSITLPEEMAHVIHERVSSGHYASVSEVIRDVMRAWLLWTPRKRAASPSSMPGKGRTPSRCARNSANG
jgi:Arc/MetJ-type ribon-helix-helix transcriptional regulator